MSDRERLKRRIDDPSPSAVRFVARLVDSLSSPPKESVRREATRLTGYPDRIEYFGLPPSIHHGGTAEPSGLTGAACTVHAEWELVRRPRFRADGGTPRETPC